jgi:hypothetical protein
MNEKSSTDSLKEFHFRSFPQKGITSAQIDEDFAQMSRWIEQNIKHRPNLNSNHVNSVLLEEWSKIRMERIAKQGLPFRHPYHLEGRLVAERAKSLSVEECNRVFSTVTVAKFCLEEMDKARNAGVKIQQVYGSWQRMAEIFHDDEEEAIACGADKHDQFQADYENILAAHGVDQDSEQYWQEFVELHILRELSPSDFLLLKSSAEDLKKKIDLDPENHELHEKLAIADISLSTSGLRYDPGSHRVVIDYNSYVNRNSEKSSVTTQDQFEYGM